MCVRGVMGKISHSTRVVTGYLTLHFTPSAEEMRKLVEIARGVMTRRYQLRSSRYS